MLLKLIRCWGSNTASEYQEIMGIFYTEEDFDTDGLIPYHSDTKFQWTQEVFQGPTNTLNLLNGLSWEQQVLARVSITTSSYNIAGPQDAQFMILWPEVPS